MHRAAIWTVAALLGALMLALVFTLGFVTNDGDDGATASVPVGETETDESRPSDTDDINFDALDEILDILQRDYVEREFLDEQGLYEAAINGLVGSLDDTGTFYVDPASYQIAIGPSGTFEGIGATVSQQGNEIVIVAPISDSPAEAAGVEAGDVILAVDGESTAGWTVDQAVLKIRGPRGSDVTITVAHLDGTEEAITITRDEIRVESVTTVPPGGVLRDEAGDVVSNLAYIRISEFSDRTPDELEPLLREAEESGMEGLILDVRGNPGGLLRETVETADMFLDEGTILVQVDREGNEEVFAATGGGPALNIPIVILQNQFSASGAEVLAAALQDNDRAVIVGEKSFGKGTVNVARQLPDGGALFVTIARWLTPAGVQIDDVGIRPDIEVVLPPGTTARDDAQLFRAVDHLRSLQASEEPAPSSATP